MRSHRDRQGGSEEARGSSTMAPQVGKRTLAEGWPAATESSSSDGESLPAAMRSAAETSTGTNLADVRVHTGPASSAAAKTLGARAFAHGRDIYFGAGEYRPGTARGDHLLAHEVVHTIQQRGQPTGAALAKRDMSEPGDAAEVEADRVADSILGGAPAVVSERAPAIARTPDGGTQEMHDELIEQFRRDNGFPPHGIDPDSGVPVGPTDSEIRFGGLLEKWLANRRSGPAASPPASSGQPPAAAPGTGVRGVAAPAQAPSIVGPGTTVVVAACKGAPDVGACRQHQNYIQNILPQTIANIRNVSSPYSAAIAAMYGAALPAAQASAAPTPGGRAVDASAGPITVTFGSTTHTFTKFTITLQQWQGGVNGQAFGVGGPIAFIMLNELSQDALLKNLSGIEATMVHEAIHIFMDIVEARNAARAPGTALVDPNIDHASYATLQASLETALAPFVTQLRALKSITPQQLKSTVQADARSTAKRFVSEAVARTEAGVFTKQRAGQAFAAGDLRALPPFIRIPDYWTPKPAQDTDFASFLQANQAQLDATIQPIILQIEERYLNLRP